MTHQNLRKLVEMENNLFDKFEPVPAKAWKQKIQYELKGKDYNERLVWESPEGIHVKPFYHVEDLENISLTRFDRPLSWYIGQQIFVSDVAKTNKKALEVLRRGAESLMFTIPSEGVDIAVLLEGINLDTVPVHFNFRFLSPEYCKNTISLFGKATGNLHLHLDSIGELARTGNYFYDSGADFKKLRDILSVAEPTMNTSILGVDTSLYQNAGANIVQQLAYALAHANEYLNHFKSDSIGPISFKIGVGGNYFFEIAKIRALRKLWEPLATEYGVSTDCHILATPSKRNKTLYEYNANMLRTTTECMSAILGGADTVCNLPYDSIYHKDNEFAERMARNQLLLLKEESYLDGIENPAAGSYYIESLTDQLAEKALLLFKDIEANGGLLVQLNNRTIQRKIKESARKEQHLFDTGEEILIGANAYQNTGNRMKEMLELYPFVKIKPRKTLIEPIIGKRLAEEVESERLKGEVQK